MNISTLALILLAVLGCVMSAGVRVKAPLGGNASVRCEYPRGSESYPKYFSKKKPEDKILTVKKATPSVVGRYSLEDDRENRVFTVTIRNLSVEDAGQYWCGMDNWGPDEVTEVNLDVVQDTLSTLQKPAIEHAVDPSTTTSSLTSSRIKPHHSLARDNEAHLTDDSVYLGGTLAAVVLLCGILITIFVRSKKRIKRATAFTQPRTRTNSNAENYIYEDIFLTSTTQRSDSVLQDSPEPSRTGLIHRPETVVYSFIKQPKSPPDEATLFPSADSSSLYYTTINFVQSSHVGHDASAFSKKSHDIYATIQK